MVSKGSTKRISEVASYRPATVIAALAVIILAPLAFAEIGKGSAQPTNNALRDSPSCPAVPFPA